MHAPTSSSPTAPPSPAASLRVVAADIKLAHSVFALPFAILAAFLAAFPNGGAIEWRPLAVPLALVVVAMVLARTVAMLANRILDQRIDAENPRTRGRALPSGRLTRAQAIGWLCAAAVGFVFVTLAFGLLRDNWWPSLLSVPVLAWISAYGLFKRFTSLCHLYLGSSLALSPIAAAIAIDPAQLAQPTLWLLAAMVLTWVAGFDVIYALQDVDVDRRDGLHSMPARLGPRGALLVSRTLHVISVVALVAAWRLDVRLDVLFGIGVGLVTMLLIVEHATVARWGTSKIALTFFTLNGVISCALGVLGCVDVVL